MRLPPLSLLSVLLLLSFSARAQHVVDPKGGGTHLDLQTAIDQARPGDWIRIRGGTWEEIVVDKSLTLLGDPMPILLAPFNGIGSGRRQPPALQLSGTGDERLRLVDVRIEGRALGSGAWTSLSAGIEAERWGSIELVRCHVHAMEWWSITGLANGAPAIRAQGALLLHAVDSWLEASDSDIYGWVGPSRVDGAPGIDAPEADVLLAGTSVFGGDAASFVLFGCPPANCPCPGLQHHGGPAVRARRLYAYGGTLQGGRGGEAWCWQGASFERRGQQPSGPEHVAQSVYAAPQVLQTQLPPRPGGAWVIGHPQLVWGGILLLGSRTREAIPIGPDLLWLDGKRGVLQLVLAPKSVQQTITVPADPKLLGFTVLGQVFDFASLRLTSPLLEIVGF